MLTPSSLHKFLDKVIARTSEIFLWIAGPCVVESETLTLSIAEELANIAIKLDLPLVFKASYRKANRTRPDSFTGIGDARALEILASVREKLNIPVLTDFHSATEAHFAAQFVDILQVPAFLCRQTDVIEAGARTGKPLNLKKGQFASWVTMKFAVEKAKGGGAKYVFVTERGTFFGYQDLIVDFRNIAWLRSQNIPVIMDCTHATQQPGALGGSSGGLREMAELYARCAISIGIEGIFMEVHPDPDNAPSDGPNMIPLKNVYELMNKLKTMYSLIKESIGFFQTHQQ